MNLVAIFQEESLYKNCTKKLSRLGECLVFHRFVFGSCLLNLFIVSMYNKNIASVYSTQRSLTSKLDEMCPPKFPFTFAWASYPQLNSQGV